MSDKNEFEERNRAALLHDKDFAFKLWQRAEAQAKQIAELRAALAADAERLNWMGENLTIIRDIGWVKGRNLREAIDLYRMS